MNWIIKVYNFSKGFKGEQIMPLLNMYQQIPCQTQTANEEIQLSAPFNEPFKKENRMLVSYLSRSCWCIAFYQVLTSSLSFLRRKFPCLPLGVDPRGRVYRYCRGRYVRTISPEELIRYTEFSPGGLPPGVSREYEEIVPLTGDWRGTSCLFAA